MSEKGPSHDAATGCQLTGVASLCGMGYADVACCNSALPALLPATALCVMTFKRSCQNAHVKI